MGPALTLGLQVLTLLLHLWVVLAILSSERRQPTATLAWILTVIFLPFVGVALYWLLGIRRTRRVRRRTLLDREKTAAAVERAGVHENVAEVPGFELDHRTASFLSLARRLTRTPPSHGNAVELLINAAAAYGSMFAAVERAERTVHVAFYTVQADEAGLELNRCLAAKARQGVRVRMLYDDVGSFGLPADFWRPVTDAGGEVAAFNPVRRFLTRWRRRDRIDFRNHRKLLVVDGRVAFTGGINVGRQYLGLDPEIGPWRDTHVRIEGPAVLCLQEVFAGDWLSATDTVPGDDGWFPEPRGETPGMSLVQVIDSGPETLWSPIAQTYNLVLAHARSRVWLTTPYFVPSETFEEMLVGASLRGVDVRLLVPERADRPLVGLASRSYFRPLLEAGARIFLYRKGFVHAKTMVVDSWVGTVGSANMDMRSFLLNFELNAFVFDPAFCDALAEQYEKDLEHAREVRPAEARGNRPQRLLYQTARLLSPLL